MHKTLMDRDIERVLLSDSEIQTIVKRIAAEIDRDYAAEDSKLLLLCILKGSVVFTGDLILDLNRSDLADCDILVVEDIIDSGRTLAYLAEYLRINGAKSVKTCTMLDKPSRREVDFTPDYIGAEIPDEFVVGYGLDYNERYRSLPYVGVLRPEIYEK